MGKKIDFIGRREYFGSLHKDFGEIRWTTVSFSGARCPETRFQSLLLGIPVEYSSSRTSRRSDVNESSSRDVLFGSLLFFLVLANSLWWASQLPFNRGPDEDNHFHFQKFVAEKGRLPRFDDEQFGIALYDNTDKKPIFITLDKQTGLPMISKEIVFYKNHQYEILLGYLGTPELAHLLAGRLSRLLGGIPWARARLFNGLCIATASILFYLCALQRWPVQRWLAKIAGLLFGFWPQLSFLGSYVNDDAFAVFTVTLLLFSCLQIEEKGFSPARSILLGVAIGLVLQSKYYTFAIFPLLGIWLILRLHSEGRRVFRFAPLILVPALLVGSWWYVQNAVRYEGDFSARKTLKQNTLNLAKSLPPQLAEVTRRPFVDALQPQGRPFTDFPILKWTKITMASYFGLLGRMDVPLSPVVYLFALSLFLAAISALVYRRFLREEPGLVLRQTTLLFSFPFFGGMYLLSLYNSYAVDMQPQGRYLLTSLPAILLLVVEGASVFPGKLGRVFPCVLVAFVVCVNLFCGFFRLV